MNTQDCGVESAPGIVIAGDTAIGDTEEGSSVGGILPEINPHDRFWLKLPRGLFESLAHPGVEQVSALFDMPCWLIEGEAARNAFLDYEKASLLFNHRRDGEFRLPAHSRAIIPQPGGVAQPRIIRISGSG